MMDDGWTTAASLTPTIVAVVLGEPVRALLQLL
jgi:hypothetical protein